MISRAGTGRAGGAPMFSIALPSASP